MMNEKRSYTEYLVVGTPQTQFAIGFEDYQAEKDMLKVTVDNKDITEAGYAVTRNVGNVLEFNPTVPVASIVRIQRVTDIDAPFYIFTAGNSFVPSNVDANFKQLLHSQQEVKDRQSHLEDRVIPVVDSLEEALTLANEASRAAQEASEAAQEAAQTTRSASNVIDDSGLNQQQINDRTTTTVDSIADLIAIQNPKDGQVVETKSYHTGLGKGGSQYIFNMSLVGTNNKVTVLNGWALQISDRICVTQAGCKLDDTADDSVAFNACSNLDLPMSAKVSGRMRCLSPLILNHSGFIGSGMFFQINVVGGHDGVILPLGGGRLFQNIERFFMLSSDNSAQNHFAIRSKEITSPATESLGNGFKIRDIEIGGGGRFGCGIALTDCFRASISEIGMTSCANAVILYGRVVQCKVGVVTSNSDEFAPSNINSTVLTKLTALPATVDKTKRYGLLVTGSTHTGTYQYPESIKSRDNAYVKHDYGLYHYDGLFCSYKDIDLDYNLINGAYFYSCNGLITLDTCWIAQNEGASHGIVIDTSTVEAKRLVIRGVFGLAYGALLSGSSVIHQTSDGISLPHRRGVEIDGVTLASSFWTRGIDFNRMKDFTLSNFIEEGNAIDKGVSLLNCENFEYVDSISHLSNIDTPSGHFIVSRVNGEVTYNFLDFSTADKFRPSATSIQNKPLEMQGFGGAWKAPIKFGGGFLWITSTGKLMKKVGSVSPISDTDGVEIS